MEATSKAQASTPMISMYLGGSKYWWTYLALLSNPTLVARMGEAAERAIFFDDASLLPPHEIAADHTGCRYFYIFWDGLTLTDAALLKAAGLLLGSTTRLSALVVGEYAQATGSGYGVECLYAEGQLRYDKVELRFDARTRSIVRSAKMKTLLMPLKNILQNKKSRWPSLELLFASRRVVFCGSYGTIPKMMQALCERRSIDHTLFDAYEYFCMAEKQTYAIFREYVARNGVYLASLHRLSAIDDTFFLSAVHLIGREYFVERIRASGMKIFANGYATGININVYTTPFYRQHVYPDFGSVVGTGNYPRLADLVYFKKKTVNIQLEAEVTRLAAQAADGLLIEHFDRLWDVYGPALAASMRQ